MADLNEPSPKVTPAPEGAGEAKTPAAAFWPQGAAVLPPKLPEIAKKHDDLEAIKKAVEDAASVSGPLWLSYLFALFSIALAAAGVTHTDLLVENPVELPFLNIKLALKAFFVLAPILFLILHVYTLMYFVLLGAKASQFHDRLYEQIPNDEKIREGLRRQLPSNIFVQFLAGPREFRDGAFGRLLRIIAWTTLVIFPMAVLLLLLQLQFLPYHNSGITWTNRIVILIDYLLIGWLWPSILGGRTGLLEGWRWWIGFKPQSAMAALGLFAVGFSWGVATFPGEWKDVPYSLPPVSSLEAMATSARDMVFGTPSSKWDKRDKLAWPWPTNTLRLRAFDIYEALKTESEKIRWKTHSFDLRHRHLEHADFSLARLDNVDLEHAQLQGALLEEAQLQGASLEEAQLQGALLEEAQLQGASLSGAFVWRSEWEELRAKDVAETWIDNIVWSPVWKNGREWGLRPWNDQSYRDLVKLLERIPEGDMHEEARKRVERLDCKKTGEDLASCNFDPKAGPPPKVEKWRSTLEGARAQDVTAYRRALAKVLSDLICGGDASAIHVLRGLANNQLPLVDGGVAKATQFPDLFGLNLFRLDAAGGEAATLIKEILNDEDHRCPVSAALTAEDRAMLLETKKRIEQAAETEPPPSPPPAPEEQAKKSAQPSAAASNRANSSRTRSGP